MIPLFKGPVFRSPLYNFLFQEANKRTTRAGANSSRTLTSSNEIESGKRKRENGEDSTDKSHLRRKIQTKKVFYSRVHTGLENRTPQTERRSKTERFKSRFSSGKKENGGHLAISLDRFIYNEKKIVYIKRSRLVEKN